MDIQLVQRTKQFFPCVIVKCLYFALPCYRYSCHTILYIFFIIGPIYKLQTHLSLCVFSSLFLSCRDPSFSDFLLPALISFLEQGCFAIASSILKITMDQTFSIVIYTSFTSPEAREVVTSISLEGLYFGFPASRLSLFDDKNDTLMFIFFIETIKTWLPFTGTFIGFTHYSLLYFVLQNVFL